MTYGGSLTAFALGPTCVAMILVSHIVWVGARAADNPEIRQSNRTFLPDKLTVPRNTLVRFSNEERITHHAYVSTPGFSVDSGDIPPGGEAALLFDTEGRFVVRCAIHPSMRVEIVVTP